MGEAGNKKRRKEAFLERHPYCCFCGGYTLATTVDHVPSRQLFSLRRRPKGIEVPACASCNQATKEQEQVAAMLGRLLPDGKSDSEQDEMARIMRAVYRNSPEIYEELIPSSKQLEQGASVAKYFSGVGGVLNCNGPLVNKCIQEFGAKLGYALHYETTRRIVPLEGGVAVKWFTNYNAVTDGLPSELLKILGPEKTLQQGTWEVSDQFNYAYAIADTQALGAYFATFRISFAVLCWIAEDRMHFGDVEEIHRPGTF